MKRKKVKSSNIKSIGFKHNILEVEFLDKNVYRYYGVDEELYENLMKSESVGSFFSRNIKNDFMYRKMKKKEGINGQGKGVKTTTRWFK